MALSMWKLCCMCIHEQLDTQQHWSNQRCEFGGVECPGNKFENSPWPHLNMQISLLYSIHKTVGEKHQNDHLFCSTQPIDSLLSHGATGKVFWKTVKQHKWHCTSHDNMTNVVCPDCIMLHTFIQYRMYFFNGHEVISYLKELPT